MDTSSLEHSKYGSIRLWFRSAEAIGEFIGIRFGRLAPHASEPEWVYYPHADHDGIGAFADILRNRGAEITQLPQIKYYPAYSPLVAALKHWPKYMLPRRPLPLQSLERDGTDSSPTEPARAVAWHVFDEGTTQQLRLESRKNGFTINTLLLKALSEAVRPQLLTPQASIPWMIPVNMRGGVDQFRDTDNHSSYVTVSVAPDESAFVLQHRILKSLSRGQHWGNWHAFKLGSFLTGGMREILLARGLCLSQWSIGAFSNLGEWDHDKRINTPTAAGDWLFMPPTLRTQMIAAGCVTFQGRLSLALQTHPRLTTSQSTVENWVVRWASEVFRTLSTCGGTPPLPESLLPQGGRARTGKSNKRADLQPV